MASMQKAEAAAQQAQQQAQQQEMVSHMLSQICTLEARERLERIALVQPDKAEQVKRMLISMAQSRQLGGKVGDKQLVEMLESLGGSDKKKQSKVVIQRRTGFDSESSDDFDFD